MQCLCSIFFLSFLSIAYVGGEGCRQACLSNHVGPGNELLGNIELVASPDCWKRDQQVPHGDAACQEVSIPCPL